MSGAALRDQQMTMARYLRDPDCAPAPEGVEQRRLKIYQDLIYNNVEGFISGGFPVLRSLYSEEDWHPLVRSFINAHRCQSPYFLEISQEFIQYLLSEHESRDCDPPFMAELAHYEWVELALDVSEEVPPPISGEVDILQEIPRLSALAWVLSYQWPVHRIGPGYCPDEVSEPSYLTVYRDCDEAVQFIELNAATARLLELVRENDDKSGASLLQSLAAEMNLSLESMRKFGASQLRDFYQRGVIVIGCN